MLEFDEHATRQIQRLYSTPDVVEQREQVLALLSPQPGERILDVGSGPGFLVASMADAVGNHGAVHGLDPSTPINAVARELAASRPWVSIDAGDALTLPYPGATFDAAVSTQAYEYIADIPYPNRPHRTTPGPETGGTHPHPRHRLGLRGLACHRP
jgi:ubiquinone/menaquinone biosynthesis C-methylase UbiE